ncbi:MAG: cyclase family protein, partial [Solirubrobacteraceae bacterium]
MPGIAELAARSRVWDLTHALTPEFPLLPVYDPVEVADKFSLAERGFFVRSWSFDEHCGTHVDAPAHFATGAATVEKISPGELVLEAAVVDIRERVRRDHNAVLVPDDLSIWERRHGRLPDRCAVLVLTGWVERAGNAESYLNMDASGVMHFPGFSVEAVEYLQHERPGVRAIGLDAPSLDFGPSTEYPAHRSWLPSGRFGIE